MRATPDKSFTESQHNEQVSQLVLLFYCSSEMHTVQVNEYKNLSGREIAAVRKDVNFSQNVQIITCEHFFYGHSLITSNKLS